MEQQIIMPGSYDPPTYGHLEIARQAAEIFPALTIMASQNPDKSCWFSQPDRAKLWQAYGLPANVTVTTLEEMKRQGGDFSNVVMVRGIRNNDDFLHEQKVMDFNFSQVGISKYFYLMTTGKFRELSSSAARRAATQLDLAALPDLVAPQIVTRLLRYVLDAQNIFLVAGRTGSGKSTWLDAISRVDPRAYCIRADNFNSKLRPEMERLFPGENLVDVAMNREDEYLEAFKPKWLLLMARQLSQAPFGSNIYIEAAYGLEDNKRLYENIGGDIIYVYCDNADTNRQRVVKRGTAHHQAFVEKIPDLAQSRRIATEHRLNLREFNTDFPLEELDGRVTEFVQKINPA